jgi:hypothetical protein
MSDGDGGDGDGGDGDDGRRDDGDAARAHATTHAKT